MTQTEQNLAYLRDVSLSVWVSGDRFKASYTFNGPDGQVSSDPEIDLGFDRGMLKQLLSSIETSLCAASQSGLWSELENPIGVPETDAVRKRHELLLEAVVSEGARLYSHLSKIHLFDDFLRRVEELADGSRITIQTQGAIIPWEILYPLPFNKESPSKPTIDKSKLWGCRFEIEQMILRKGKTTDWGVKDHQSTPAYVSLNLNPQIDAELSGGAFPSRYKPGDEHKNFYVRKLGEERGDFLTKGNDIKSAVLSQTKATVIYLYCHGRGADDQGKELLELDDKVYIEPETVAFEQYYYTSGPLLILNSCSSGAYSPLSLTNFYSEFKDKRAIGVIGTMMPMPATFASAFGIRLIDDYVNYAGDQPVTIGSVLRKLRRELVEFDNPLGLLYVLQCPLHATAKRA